MYQVETIRRVMKIARERGAALSEMPIEKIPLCISKGNVKIGRVMNVSIMPILTCKHCSGCAWLCYDIKACSQYPGTVIDARMRNTTLLKRDRDEFFARIDDAMNRRRKSKYFRWHVAGDIPDVDYFDRMVENARRHPDFVIWTYTKHYEAVNEWVAAHGGTREAVPANLTVMFSEWRGMPMVNPYGFPEFRVVFKDDADKPAGHYCPGNCDICKTLHRGCVVGETTYCNEH